MAAPPYDTLETIVTASRVRLNDAIQSAGGEVLTDAAVFTIQTINSAYRRMQEFLAESNAARLINEGFVLGLPANVGSDPGGNATLSWAGYNPKSTNNPAFTLPADMIFPLRLWERVSGSNLPFTDMEYCIDGIQNYTVQGRNYSWEWREDALFLPGSNVSMDLKMRYAAYLPDFVPSGTTAFALQNVPIIRCLDAFAWYICSEMANARGDIDGATFDTKAEAAAKRIIGRDSRVAALRSQWVIPDIPPNAGNTPYDSVSTMLNTVRTRMNALAKNAGDVVTASQPFTQQCVNTGWRRMQQFMISLKSSRLLGLETQISGVPAVATTDPGTQCSLSWSGFVPGNGVLNAGFKLPSNMIRPVRMWERTHGSTNQFTPMEYNQQGLGTQPKQNRNYAWQWTGDEINLPGSTVAMDLRISYVGYLPDFVNGASPWYLQTIPIARALDALAWYTCFEIGSARPDLGLDVDAIKGLQSSAETACTQIVLTDTQAQDQRGEWIIPDAPAAQGNTPYDTAGNVLNVTRARLNKVSTIAGDVISAQNPFTQQYFNTAFRRLQEFLANLGYIRLTDEVILTGVPTVTTLDPSSQVSLSWVGFFDGTNWQSSPILPQDMIFPLKIWERQSGSNLSFNDPMENMLDGLQTLQKNGQNCQWEWRSDAIYMPGATFPVDLRIRYAKFLPDLALASGYNPPAGATPWYGLPVPIARCSDALSLYICTEVASARPDLELDSGVYKAMAEDAAKLIYNRDVKAKQRVNVRRQSRSGRLEGREQYDYCY